MLEAFFGLSRRPFAAAPDPQFFVDIRTADEALTELRRCVQHGEGIGIVTAAAGMGKTLLCRKLEDSVSDVLVPVFLPNANFPTRRSLLQAMLYELGHPYIRMAEQELRIELTTALRALREDREGLLLVVDEAHQLGDRILEELRAMTNLTHRGTPLVRVVLSGQMGLEESLASPAMEFFNQRVAAQVSLESLTRQESGRYIEERVRQSGGSADRLFTSDALQLICHASDGLPRCINHLCDQSLKLAYSAKARRVDQDMVREALEHLKQLPFPWNEPAVIRAPSYDRTEAVERENQSSEEAWSRAEQAAGEIRLQPDSVSCRGWESGEQSSSVEFGADLPSKSSPTKSESSRQKPLVEAAIRSQLSSSRSTPVVQPKSGSTSSTSSKSSNWTGGDEELVVDRYAALDAGRPYSSKESVRDSRQMERDLEYIVPMIDDVLDETQSSSMNVDSPRIPDPLETEEELTAQISAAALEAWCEIQEAVRMTDGDVLGVEEYDVSPSAEIDGSSDVEMDAAMASYDVVQPDGSGVREVEPAGATKSSRKSSERASSGKKSGSVFGGFGRRRS